MQQLEAFFPSDIMSEIKSFMSTVPENPRLFKAALLGKLRNGTPMQLYDQGSIDCTYQHGKFRISLYQW